LRHLGTNKQQKHCTLSTYIIADTHGCLKTLQKLLENEIGITPQDSLYFLGDYIDRGRNSAQLVDYLINLRSNGYSVTCLMGNHEQMLLDAIQDDNVYNDWMLHFGFKTIDSYTELIGQQFSFPKDIPQSHIDFYQNLPFFIELDQCVLVHGGFNFGAENPLLDTRSMLWMRTEMIPDSFMPNKVVMYGHTPTSIETIKKSIKARSSRQIPLDAGCVYYGMGFSLGYLVALELENWKLHIVKNSEIL